MHGPHYLDFSASECRAVGACLTHIRQVAQQNCTTPNPPIKLLLCA